MSLAAVVCLATTLWLEARGQPEPDAMLAVADVVMERVVREEYPDTVCAVVSQRRQFAYLPPERMEQKLTRAARGDVREWGRALRVAGEVIWGGERLGMGATHFYSGPRPGWAHVGGGALFVGSMGAHRFWRLR